MNKQTEHVVHNVHLCVTILYNSKLKLERLIFVFTEIKQQQCTYQLTDLMLLFLIVYYPKVVGLLILRFNVSSRFAIN
jgi:hypothetical protein